MSSSQRARARNFSSDEISALESAVEKHYEGLFGKYSSKLTKEAKNIKWQKVAQAVSIVSNNPRTVLECKVKWKNVKSTTKDKIAGKTSKTFMNKTGGGPPRLPLTNSEERVAALIGTNVINGLEGGIDTSGNVHNY